jgi:hypothetical protein
VLDCHAHFVKQGQVGIGALLLSLNPTLTLVANSEFGFKCLQSPCSEDGILRVLTRKPQATGSKCTRNEFATSVNFAVNEGNLYPARCCCLLLSNCRVADNTPATFNTVDRSVIPSRLFGSGALDRRLQMVLIVLRGGTAGRS